MTQENDLQYQAMETTDPSRGNNEVIGTTEMTLFKEKPKIQHFRGYTAQERVQKKC